MNENKYTVSILNSKWQPIKRNVKMSIIPRSNEFIYLESQYYEVLNVVHNIGETQDIFIIVNEFINKLTDKKPDNEIVEK